MRKIFKLGYKTIAIVIILVVIFINFKLYYHPTFTVSNKNYYNQDVYYQLNFLKDKLHDDGAAYEMQQIYPEGFVFINVLYGLSWCDLIKNLEKETEIYEKGVSEINWSIKQLNSETAKEIFDKDLTLNYGVFYRGWTNYLLGKRLMLQIGEQKDAILEKVFHKNCDEIANALYKSKSPFLESYKDQFWPADIVTAVASLKLHDKLFEKKYSKTINDWLVMVASKLDDNTGLIPHSVDNQGNVMEGARGSSQSLLLNFLIEIDKKFANQQFKIYKEKFLTKRFGLFGIREYPKKVKTKMDIDSGPIILEVGGSASIVGQRTMANYSDFTIYESLRNSIELFGIPYTSHKKKKYLLGELPMADAFIGWSNAIENNKNRIQNTKNWRINLQIGTLILFGILIWFYKIIK